MGAAQIVTGVIGGGIATTAIVGLFAAASASASTVGDVVGLPTPQPTVVEAVKAPQAAAQPLLLARWAQSPCQSTTARYRAAQDALAGGDIDAADDLAVIAQALIQQCGWTPVDAALGGRRG